MIGLTAVTHMLRIRLNGFSPVLYISGCVIRVCCYCKGMLSGYVVRVCCYCMLSGCVVRVCCQGMLSGCVVIVCCQGVLLW